jgi:hypothetical protein
MPLHGVPESELRDHCKRSIEALEYWLRRLIHLELSRAYGPNYIDELKPDGARVIRSEMARRLKERAAGNPSRFARPIDAALLDDEIDVICNHELYKTHFSPALGDAFPEGPVEARTFLSRLVEPRNRLAHAHGISVHDASRILCYTQDVIAALKEFYKDQNLQQQFNAPLVIRVVDSLGHVTEPSARRDGPVMLDYSNDPSSYLRCGDTISIEVDVDVSFDPSSYAIQWLISNIGGPTTYGRHFSLVLTERYVWTRFCAVCRVISKASWHRFGTHDDQLDIAYRVLPPL